MGIDACMLVRGINCRLTDSELKKVSAILVSRVTASSSGRPFYLNPKEGQLAIDLAPSVSIEPNEVGKDIIDIPPGKGYMSGYVPILAAENEWIYNISLLGRFYGIGYERGHLWDYIAIAETLEHIFPNCTVLYGGDEESTPIMPFGKMEREHLISYLCSPIGLFYYVSTPEKSRLGTDIPPKIPEDICKSCPDNHANFFQCFGWYINRRKWMCLACRQVFVCDVQGKNIQKIDSPYEWPPDTTVEKVS